MLSADPSPTGVSRRPTDSVGQTGQADYCAQWAQYYRSMGMVKEAEAIEAARGGGPSAAPAPQPAAPAAAPGGGPGSQNGAGGADYSAQWAEYYRSIGKLKEAEAIEQQMKQKVREDENVPQQITTG